VRLKWRGKTVAVRTGEIKKRKNNKAACVSPDADHSTLEAASFHATKEFNAKIYLFWGFQFSLVYLFAINLLFRYPSKVYLYHKGFKHQRQVENGQRGFQFQI